MIGTEKRLGFRHVDQGFPAWIEQNVRESITIDLHVFAGVKVLLAIMVVPTPFVRKVEESYRVHVRHWAVEIPRDSTPEIFQAKAEILLKCAKDYIRENF